MLQVAVKEGHTWRGRKNHRIHQGDLCRMFHHRQCTRYNHRKIIVDALDLNLRLGFQWVNGTFRVIYCVCCSRNLYRSYIYIRESSWYTVSGPLNVITGFEVEFPDDPLSRELVEEILKGIKAKSLPTKFKSGAGCFNVALRLKLKAGTSVEVFYFGFKFEAAAYIDAPLYKACITCQPDQSCSLHLTEIFIIDVVVYAEAAKAIEFLTWVAGPTVVSTMFVAQLPSTCFIGTTSSTQYSLAPSMTSNPITPKPEIETILSQNTSEIPSTTIPSCSTNSTTSCASTEETRSRTVSFLTNSSNSTSQRDIHVVPMSRPQRQVDPAEQFQCLQQYFLQIQLVLSFRIPVPLKHIVFLRSTITNGAPFPIANTAFTLIVPTESEKHDNTTSIINDLPTITNILIPSTFVQRKPSGYQINNPPSLSLSILPLHSPPLNPPRSPVFIHPSAPIPPPISIINNATFIACPTPIIERMETTIIFSTIGISIAAYSPAVPQVINGSTWYVPGQNLWNPPGAITSSVTTGGPGGTGGYLSVADDTLSRRTETGMIATGLSRDKIRRKIPLKIRETRSTTGRRWTTSSTNATVSSIGRDSG
ncbi:uncharacterized protein EAF01_001073 [Botrytis porri]|uniref:uncharacterized protein n=1 Tax=Botrytis porri TaxID=87229 RepID=UPI0019020095|nr:uncharacterized protein EAF01_001073 [Botrytis porri]KAF7914667.1 hypothetical protein EAF01_001073 [Botrytis porri]